MLQRKEDGTDRKKMKEKMVAIIDKLLEYKWITTTQHKDLLINFKIT